MSYSLPEPTLPVELERLICETAAVLHPQCMRALILVARRIKIWIEPTLYRTLVISSSSPGAAVRNPDTLASLFNSRPQSFFQDHVRHICFADYHSLEFIGKIILTCSATVNLALLDIMGGPTLLPILDTLPLQRLSACVDRLFLGTGRMDFSRPLFSQITHLNILDWRDEGWPTWSGLADMPMLSHVSFSYHDFVPYRICKGALVNCKGLQVLVVVGLDTSLLRRFAEQQADLGDDPRFVTVLVADEVMDWKVGARGGLDYWDVAEKMVKERQLTMMVP
ncbi:hypothetical protein C8R47DRAFT_1324713 [Mycena vitilis]|nr:hypothetical protein C8R47DRAFT_1324713 [Mycena vitilis]